MDKSRRLGIYISKNAISISEIDNKKKLLGTTVLDFAEAAKKNPVVELDELVGLEALVRKGVKDISASTTEACISIADNNVFFRVFSLPNMSRSELASSIDYEAVHHIPFKMEDVYYDFRDKRIPQEKKTLISFAGTRKSYIDAILKVADSLGITIAGIEPSLVSLIRLFHLDKNLSSSFKQSKRFAIIDFSVPEANLLFFDKVQLFCREIKLGIDRPQYGQPTQSGPSFGQTTQAPPAGGLGLAGSTPIPPKPTPGVPPVSQPTPSGVPPVPSSAPVAQPVNFQKVKEELLLSFGFYNREYKNQPLDRVFVFCNEEHKDELVTIGKNFEIPFEVISPKQLSISERMDSLVSMKSYSVAAKDMCPDTYSINLGPAKKKDLGSSLSMFKSSPASQGGFVPFNMPAILIAGVIGLVAIIGSLTIVQQNRGQLQSVISMRKQEVGTNKKLSALKNEYEVQREEFTILKERLESLKRKRNIFVLFGDVTSMVGDGMWLTGLSLKKDYKTERYTFEVEGQIFLGDLYKEQTRLNSFIENLRRKKDQYYLKEVKILYSERRVLPSKDEVLRFSVQAIGE